MSDYSKTMVKHRRLAILRHLEGCSEYTSNASILADVLKGVGVQSTRGQIITELTWLRDNGFVDFADGTADFVVVEATQSGVEIATGEARHPEIHRPSARR